MRYLSRLRFLFSKRQRPEKRPVHTPSRDLRRKEEWDACVPFRPDSDPFCPDNAPICPGLSHLIETLLWRRRKDRKMNDRKMAKRRLFIFLSSIFLSSSFSQAEQEIPTPTAPYYWPSAATPWAGQIQLTCQKSSRAACLSPSARCYLIVRRRRKIGQLWGADFCERARLRQQPNTPTQHKTQEGR